MVLEILADKAKMRNLADANPDCSENLASQNIAVVRPALTLVCGGQLRCRIKFLFFWLSAKLPVGQFAHPHHLFIDALRR